MDKGLSVAAFQRWFCSLFLFSNHGKWFVGTIHQHLAITLSTLVGLGSARGMDNYLGNRVLAKDDSYAESNLYLGFPGLGASPKKSQKS